MKLERMFVNINKQGSTVQNSTRKHTKTRREGQTRQRSTPRRKAKRETRLKARARWKLRHWLWIISPLNNFFFWGGGGGQICNDEYTSKKSKNVDFDCIMKAFFWRTQQLNCWDSFYCFLTLITYSSFIAFKQNFSPKSFVLTGPFLNFKFKSQIATSIITPKCQSMMSNCCH